METIRNCFGGRQKTRHDDDQDPLLPKYTNSQTTSTQQAHGFGGTSGEPPPTKFRRNNKGGRIIDLPETSSGGNSGFQTQNARPPTQGIESAGDSKSVLDKLSDASAAMTAGKLPSQDQITHILQLFLNSELLRPDSGSDGPSSRSNTTTAAFHGTGPTSQRGRRVLEDVRSVVQAALQFGMEKNDDNKFQDLIYQLSLIEGNPIDELGDNVKLPKVEVNTSRVAESSKDAMRVGKEAVQDLKDKVPQSKEISDDAAIFVHALRTLIQTLLTSSVFRYLLTDILSIFRDFVAHGAADVGDVALQVQKVAEGFRENVENTDVAAKVDEAVENARDKSVQDRGKESVREAVGQASATAKDMKDKTLEKAAEWLDIGKDASDTVKKDLVERMQQVLVRAQEDPASRGAIRSMLILVRKYGDQLAETSDAVVEGVEKLVDKAEDVALSNVASANATDVSTWFSYPPPNTLYPPISKRPLSDSKEGPVPFKAALFDLKALLERIGQGHSLDNLLSKFGRVVKDLNNLPVEVSKSLDEETCGLTQNPGGKGKGKNNKRNLIPVSTSNASIETVKPSTVWKGGKKKKRKAGNGRGTKIQEQESISRQTSLGGGDEDEVVKKTEKGKTERPNAIRSYFIRLGDYIDRAVEEPGWVTSRTGQSDLERLFKDGVELINVVGVVVADIGEGVAEGAFGASVQDTNATEGRSQGEALELRRQFRTHAKEFIDELEKYIAVVENDRSTMKLLRAFDALGSSTSDLFFSGSGSSANTESRGRKQNKRPTLRKRVWSTLQWTEWLGWALPKIIRMVPFNALPIPSMEAKSESGGWEAGVYALFVKENAFERQVQRGLVSRSDTEGSSGRVRGGIETTLVPDQIVFKEWTEVRIDMADKGLDDCLQPLQPRVETTSRVRMHVDGIRGKVDGLGYFFKYGGDWIGYEDEGIVNVDIGMGHPHDGFGCNIEVEINREYGMGTNGTGHAPVVNPLLEEEQIGVVGEGVEGKGAMAIIPDVVASELEAEREDDNANVDIQRTLAENSLTRKKLKYDAAINKSIGIPAAGQESVPLEPLFNIIQVDVQMRGVHVKLEKSKHWILNKLLVQPLAGPAVSELVRQQVQDIIQEKLQDVAMGLAKVGRDVEVQRAGRKAKVRRQQVEGRKEYLSRMVVQGRYEVDDLLGIEDLEDSNDDDDESFGTLVEDWWHALITSVPLVFQGRNEAEESGETKTSLGATAKGVIYHQTTVPPSANPPGVVFNKVAGKIEPLLGHVHEIGKQRRVEEEAVGEDESDLTVAIGGGAQLLGDKQVPYGARNDAGQVGSAKEEGHKLLNAAMGTANNIASKAMDTAVHVGTRWRQVIGEEWEVGGGWRSSAFDL